MDLLVDWLPEQIFVGSNHKLSVDDLITRQMVYHHPLSRLLLGRFHPKLEYIGRALRHYNQIVFGK